MSFPGPTKHKPISQRLRSTLWLLLAGIILFVWLLTVPAHLQAVEQDWVLSRASSFLSPTIPVEITQAYVLFWQFIGASLFLVCALAVYWDVIRAGNPWQSLGFWVALILLLIPITIYFNAADANRFAPDVWEQILSGLSMLAFALGICGFILLYYLLPFGTWQPPWTRWAAMVTFLGLTTAFILLMIGIGGDAAWGFVLGALIVGLLVGTILLAVRFRRFMAPEQKTMGRWIVAILLLNALWIPISIFGESIGSALGIEAVVLVELHGQLILPLLIPLSILASMFRLGLWNVEISARRPVVYAGLVTVVFIGLLGLTLLSQAATRALAGEMSQPWQVEKNTTHLPLIVDTDFGNDDVLALLFLMQHPEVDLQAVTVVGTGLVHCEPGIHHVHGLLELTNYKAMPVSCGSEEPFDADHPFPKAWREGADRLWGLGLPPNDHQPASLPAPELLVELLSQADAPVSILALGPLTNFAQAFQAHPEVIQKVDHLYIMGGAVEVAGNVYDQNLGFDNQTAEWNIYADPLAAKIVFDSGVPITLIPLDATNYVPVSMQLFRMLDQIKRTRAAVFTFNIFYINQGWIQTGYYYLWDTLASAVVTNPEVATYQDYTLTVVTERGPDFGRTQPTPGGMPVRVATWADKDRFEEIFLRVVNTE